MPSWTNATPHLTPAGVILGRDRLDAAIHRFVAAPTGVAAAIVERYWRLEWHLDDDVTIPGSLVPDFGANLTWEVGSGRAGTEGRAVVTGVSTRRFEAHLSGHGSVTGIKFRAGAHTGVSGVPAHGLLDATVPATQALPDTVVDAFTAAATRPSADQVDALDAVASHLDVVDATWTDAERAVDAARRRDTSSVEHLAEAVGRTPRTLQRLLRHHVGLGPKQLITRLRLQHVVDALDSADRPPLAELAADLGFYDQAHLTREFTRFVGVPPARYRHPRSAGAAETP